MTRLLRLHLCVVAVACALWVWAERTMRAATTFHRDEGDET